jgi:hypothetical protein
MNVSSRFSFFSYKSTGGTTSRTTAARLADIINVKDYGAKGDGSTNDGAAIQKALDAAYGPVGGSNAHQWLNKGVYIPAGKYLVDQQLVLAPVGGSASAAGAWLFGDGQRNTRLVYTGPNSNLFGGITALLTTQFMNYSRVQGMTFDVTGSNSTIAVHNADVSPGSNGGTGVSWIDCGFVGASSFGILFDQNSEGSEQLYVGCTFDNCSGVTSPINDLQGTPIGGGLVLRSANALDHTVIGCRFSNNGCGVYAPLGGVMLVEGCNFHNNSRIDVFVKQQNAPAIVGCYSDSTTFCLAGPVWIAGCYHNTSNVGTFLDASLTYFAFDNPLFTIEGCYSPNSKLIAAANNGCKVYLRGNTFSRSDYLTGWNGTVGENI